MGKVCGLDGTWPLMEDVAEPTLVYLAVIENPPTQAFCRPKAVNLLERGNGKREIFECG